MCLKFIMMKSLVLLMSVVLIGISSAAPYDGYRKETMLKNAISKLAEKIGEAKQQRYEQMEEKLEEATYQTEKFIALIEKLSKEAAKVDKYDQMEEAMDEQHPNYLLEEAEEEEDNIETDQADNAIALMNTSGKIGEDKYEVPDCWCFEAHCPGLTCQNLPSLLAGICVPVPCDYVAP